MASTINEDCIGCGNCEPECPNGAIHSAPGEMYAVDPQVCDDCAGTGHTCLGVDICPTEAIVPASAGRAGAVAVPA